MLFACARAIAVLSAVAGRTAAAALPLAWPVEEAVARDRRRPFKSDVLAETPFFRLVRLNAGVGRRRILFLPPYSGYAVAVASPLIAALLDLGEVVVVDWHDARVIPAIDGRFGLREQTEAARALLEALPLRLHLVGLSQSCPALLMAAAAHAADHPGRRPASLSLLGGPLEPRRRPTTAQRLITAYPRAVLMAGLTHLVPAPLPGAGRQVYPALFQLAVLIAADPPAYAALHAAVLAGLAGSTPPAAARAHEDLHGLLDVPAELFLDMVDWLDGRGESVATLELGGLARVPILTVEAGRDDLVGRGQTHAIRRRLGQPPGAAVDLPEAQHQALFTGPAFQRHLAPRLRQVIGADDG